MVKNIADNGYRPCITVKKGKANLRGHRVEILDAAGNVVATIVQPQDQQLACGARVWIETHATLRVVSIIDGPVEAVSSEQVITL